MWEWLLSPMDASRAHEVGLAVSWHGRAMVIAWGVLAPLAVIIARFFKVWPGQDWPREVDNLSWWRTHWIGQSCVTLLTVVGFVLVLPPNLAEMSLHNWLGYTVLALLIVQVLMGLFRGSKGGPTDKASDGSERGHHYDMTPWRLMFEAVHKSTGYALLGVAAGTILLGLWKANGPNWMWLSLLLWWTALGAGFVVLQRRGMAIDTYQAIWGADPAHPGNRRPHPGWGVRRYGRKDDADVRSDRGDGVRSH